MQSTTRDNNSNPIIKKVPNRCNAYTDTTRKCRAKLGENKLFCCKNHEPINREIIEEGCFICQEMINDTNKIIYFNCNHAFHKPCYYEWLEYSTYEKPICLICRNENIYCFLKLKKIKKNLKTKYYYEPYSIKNILYNTLENNNEIYKINYGTWESSSPTSLLQPSVSLSGLYPDKAYWVPLKLH
jgi:hypothetical protein